MERNLELLKALADLTRLRLLHLLTHRGPELCVCDLVETLELPQSTISRQIAPLRMLGLVKNRRFASWVHYSLAEPESDFHRALCETVGLAGGGGGQLAEDIKRFDRLKKKKELACCQVDFNRLAAAAGRKSN